VNGSSSTAEDVGRVQPAVVPRRNGGLHPPYEVIWLGAGVFVGCGDLGADREPGTRAELVRLAPADVAAAVSPGKTRSAARAVPPVIVRDISYTAMRQSDFATRRQRTLVQNSSSAPQCSSARFVPKK
jgi:hypothetical protein